MPTSEKFYDKSPRKACSFRNKLKDFKIFCKKVLTQMVEYGIIKIVKEWFANLVMGQKCLQLSKKNKIVYLTTMKKPKTNLMSAKHNGGA